MKQVNAMKPAAKWIIVCLALVAAGLSLWLTVEKLSGRINSLAGCGTGSGCANVLGSKWSMVLGVIPVSVFSFLLYVAVIVSLWLRGAKMSWFRMLAAWLFLGAAVWFTALQLFVLKTVCPYCMTMHAVGVLLGLVILVAEIKVPGVMNRAITSITIAMAMIIGLAAVQYVGPKPETHRVDDGGELGSSTGGKVAVTPHTQGEGRLVTFFGGGKSYRVDTLPHVGSKTAEHVIVKYFDYTCDACKDVHGDLDKMMAKYPGKLAVIVLPVPLNNQCNPHLPLGVKNHRNACEFAKLALKVWRADPTKFGEFHSWLFDYHEQPYEAAEAMAYSLVGADKMTAVEPAWVEGVLKENLSDYKVLVQQTPVMPKMVLKDSKVMQGVTKDVQTFERILQETLGLKKG